MLNLNDLKNEYIGKTFNWLTVLDVVRDNGVLYFICKCKCSVIKRIQKKLVLSGKSVSCGCYRKSKEKVDKYKEWCKNNPDKVKERANKFHLWASKHHDLILERGNKYSEWCLNNPDKKRDSVNKKIATYEAARSKIDYSVILDYVHPDDVSNLLSGKITARSIIRTKCPLCGSYDSHALHNVFTFSTGSLKFRSNMTGDVPLCSKCVKSHTTSSSEKEIADYISTFYNGTLIRNSRGIISPFELDLYYPEKKIAIEFNGDYWHNEDHRSKDYHYNKFIECRNNSIILVSIFETEWITNKDNIKSYLYDLFSSKENALSFKDGMLNNNYPSSATYQCGEHVEDFYIHRDRKVFTCGYTKLI